MPKSEQTSWVFANVKGGITRAISQVQKINNVDTVTPVTGRFDLVIKLRTNEPTKAFNIVQKIRKIKGITSTQTGLSVQKISKWNNSNKDEPENPIAFALLKVKGTFNNVLQKIKSFPNLVEAHVMPGEFDVLAAFHGYSPEELLETSVEKLSNLNGVTSTETLVSWTPTSPY